MTGLVSEAAAASPRPHERKCCSKVRTGVASVKPLAFQLGRRKRRERLLLLCAPIPF
jgi:hypothetical protein